MRFKACSPFLLVLALAVSRACGAPAVVYHLTMDDLPLQPVHGLAHELGVEFAFTVNGQPSDDALYASGGPGTTTFIQDPSIEGNSMGTLFVGFSEPVPFVQFGVARSEIARGVAAIVEVFDAENVSQGVTNLSLLPMLTYPEGQFTYNGTPISRFTLRFAPAPAAGRFAFDNLRFGAIPEPATGAIVAAVAGMLGAMRRRRESLSLGERRECLTGGASPATRLRFDNDRV
jgi:hypothetical protein